MVQVRLFIELINSTDLNNPPTAVGGIQVSDPERFI